MRLPPRGAARRSAARRPRRPAARRDRSAPSPAPCRPGDSSSRPRNSSACCEPEVMTMLSGLARHAEAAHVAHDPLPQRQIALADRVLQGGAGRAGSASTAAIGGARLRDRKQRRVGNAAGERDDAGLVQQLQQLADLGGAHPARARREMLGPSIVPAVCVPSWRLAGGRAPWARGHQRRCDIAGRRPAHFPGGHRPGRTQARADQEPDAAQLLVQRRHRFEVAGDGRRTLLRWPAAEPHGHAGSRGCGCSAWFQALMPKEERFFELFVRQSRLLVRRRGAAGAAAGRRDGPALLPGDHRPERRPTRSRGRCCSPCAGPSSPPSTAATSRT